MCNRITSKNALNMIKAIVTTFLVTVVSVATYASDYQSTPAVSPLAYQINAQRVGDVVFRSVEFFEGYPCLRLETFTVGYLKPVDRKEVCKFRTDRGVIDVRKERLTGVIHENLKLEKNIFHFSTEIIFAGPGHYYANCKVVISDNGKMTEPACTRGERPPEPDANK